MFLKNAWKGLRSGRPVPNYENRLGPNWAFFQGRVSLIKKTLSSTGELTHYEVVDPNSQFRQMVSAEGNRSFSLTWQAAILIYSSKRKRLHKNGVHFPQECFGSSKWPQFLCLGISIWPPWWQVKTIYKSWCILLFLCIYVKQTYLPHFGLNILLSTAVRLRLWLCVCVCVCVCTFNK